MPTFQELLAAGPEEEGGTPTPDAPVTPSPARLNFRDLVAQGAEEDIPVDAAPVPLGGDLLSRVGQEGKEMFLSPRGWTGPQTWAPPLGGAIGAAVGGPPGAILGSGLATAGAEMYGQYKESQQPGGQPFDPFGKGAEGLAWETGLDVGLGAIPYVGAGRRGAVALTKKVLAPLRDTVDEVHAAANALNVAKHIPTSAVDYSGNRVLSGLEKFTHRFPFLTGSAQKFISGKEQSLEAMTEKVLRGVDPDYDAISKEAGGKFALASAEKKLEKAQEWSTVLFQAPTHIVPPDATFATPDILNEAQSIIQEIARGRDIAGVSAGTVAGQARLPNMPAVMASDIPDHPVAKAIDLLNLDKPGAREMTYERLELLRKELGQLEFQYRGTNEGRYFAMLSNKLGKGYDEVGRVFPEVKKQIDRAKSYNRVWVQKAFKQNEAYKKMSEGDASTVVERMFPPSISVEEVRQVMRTMPEEARKKMRSALLYNLSGTRPGMVPKAFGYGEEMVRNINQYDPVVLETLFGKQDFKEIKDAVTAQANAGRSLEAGRGQDIATAGAVGQQLGTMTKLGGAGAAAFGAAAGLGGYDPVTGGLVGATVATMTPYAVAKFMNSKWGRAYLTTGKIPKDENFPGGLARVMREGGKIAVGSVGGIPQSLLRRVTHDWAFPEEEQPAHWEQVNRLTLLQRAFGGGVAAPPR